MNNHLMILYGQFQLYMLNNMWYRLWKPIFNSKKLAPLGVISSESLKTLANDEANTAGDDVINTIPEARRYLERQGYIVKAEKEVQTK